MGRFWQSVAPMTEPAEVIPEALSGSSKEVPLLRGHQLPPRDFVSVHHRMAMLLEGASQSEVLAQHRRCSSLAGTVERSTPTGPPPRHRLLLLLLTFQHRQALLESLLQLRVLVPPQWLSDPPIRPPSRDLFTPSALPVV